MAAEEGIPESSQFPPEPGETVPTPAVETTDNEAETAQVETVDEQGIAET